MGLVSATSLCNLHDYSPSLQLALDCLMARYQSSTTFVFRFDALYAKYRAILWRILVSWGFALSRCRMLRGGSFPRIVPPDCTNASCTYRNRKQNLRQPEKEIMSGALFPQIGSLPLTAAHKLIHTQFPSLTDSSPLEAFSILFLAAANTAIAKIQASQEINEVAMVHTKARTSMMRLLQHQAKNANPSVINEKVRATYSAVSLEGCFKARAAHR